MTAFFHGRRQARVECAGAQTAKAEAGAHHELTLRTARRPQTTALVDEQLGEIARVYHGVGGPQDGTWFWSVLVDAQGRPWNSGSRSVTTDEEAKAAVEMIIAGFGEPV